MEIARLIEFSTGIERPTKSLDTVSSSISCRYQECVSGLLLITVSVDFYHQGCDLMIKKGPTIDKDQYDQFICNTLTNIISCKGDRGKYMGRRLQ
ncbi:hypothetical protein DFH28DRAFT_555334 [Melampsora americana]|nr:hypothetical protein DFH28DRAFT_555334 [Melampsora americana]